MGCASGIALYNFFWVWFTGVIGLDKGFKVRIYNDGHSNGPIKINKEIVDPFSGIPSLTASYKDSIIYVCSTIPESITGLNI